MVRIINIDTKARTIRVSNGKDDLDWFTTDTGSHVPLKKGQSKAEAIKEHFGDGRSSGKKRLDELNKKYGTNKGYLIQSDRPLDKKKDGAIKEYEDFGKATPEVSLTETGSGFHERTKQPAKQELEEKAHRIATNLFSAINTSQFTDAQLKSMISSFIYDEADNLDDDGVVTKDELNSEEFKRLKKFVDEKLNVPAKKETPDTSNADYFKSTMQETMKKFPRLYEHEEKHLEEFATSAFSALRNNPGKEKAIVDEILDSFNQHVKRLGMWVDTPTLAKKAFVEKLAEAYK